MKTIALLICSNIFMNLAWYAHLKFRKTALVVAILASWGIALFEYILLRGAGAKAIYRDPADLLEHYDQCPIAI